MSGAITRAQLLLHQSRYELAEKEVRRALGEDPDNVEGHAILAICLAEQGSRAAEALEAARRAVSLAPDESHTHYVLATVLHLQDKHAEAEAAIGEAIRLDPEDADYFGRLAAIHLDRKQWKQALAATEQGLALDAEHVMCANIRAIALTKVGRRKEAGATIDQALSRDPGNPVTHANMGWTRLESGDPTKAMEHFREALRIDPTSEWAQAGIVEALRARHLVYRVVLQYFFWMSRLSGRAQWIVIIGLYVAFRIVGSLQQSHPEWSPVLTPLLILYLIFAVLTWLARPLFNLLLRCNKFGRLALSERETTASNWVGGLFLAGLGCLVTWVLGGSGLFLLLAIYFLAMMLPVNTAVSHAKPLGRRPLVLYTLGLAALGPLALLVAPVNTGLNNQLMFAFLIGWIGFQWFANYIAIRS